MSYYKAIQYNKNSGIIWYNREILLGKLKQYEEALESYNQALKIDPYDSRAWNNRGLVLESLQRHDEAFKSYQKATAIAQRTTQISFTLQTIAKRRNLECLG
ncbi:MAG: tetratricopeptide repeat protein [Coleofasciculus sp. D1-CHI-01]|uniref:tetratricopeptide repeat protein n=1 Tax=Coleofasciculus sp. D1-CHI-01 TaxID=3068482 RepID=UPI0033026D2F